MCRRVARGRHRKETCDNIGIDKMRPPTSGKWLTPIPTMPGHVVTRFHANTLDAISCKRRSTQGGASRMRALASSARIGHAFLSRRTSFFPSSASDHPSLYIFASTPRLHCCCCCCCCCSCCSCCALHFHRVPTRTPRGDEPTLDIARMAEDDRVSSLLRGRPP